MRCDGPDNPPCTRCRLSGQACVFEKVTKPDQLDGTSLERLADVETEIAAVKGNQTVMQSTLNEILNELRKSNKRSTDSSIDGRTTTGAGPTMSNGLSDQGSSSPPTSAQAAHFSSQRVDSNHLPSLHSIIEVINDLAASTGDNGRPPRKRKRTESFGVEDYEMDPAKNAEHSGVNIPYETKELDVVEKGLISEAEAQELYALWVLNKSLSVNVLTRHRYFSGCYRILAMFDPKRDTYQSLRRRSPFCFCCLLMVGAKVRDGGRQPSPIQLSLEREASEAVKETLFKAVKRVEIVQGMLLIAAWSYSAGGTGWITAGHALRCAVDLGLDKALQHLSVRTKEGKSGDGEVDQNLVRACRTWCALFVFEYQLAFGMRRPAMMGDNAKEHIDLARDTLLKHPLSIPTDVRLVSTCQLLCIQYRIHQRLDFDRDQIYSNQYIIDVLRDARNQIDAWQSEWDRVMSVNHDEHGFYRSSAAIQRAYAHLFHNSLAMQNIRTKAQAKAISPEIKGVAFEAVEAAKEALNIVLHTVEYREGLRFAISYTHICAAFAGGFLLRMARLFPNDFDINQTCALVESLAGVLSEVPAKRFSEALYNMLASLRQKKQSSNATADIHPSFRIAEPSTQDPSSILAVLDAEGVYSAENMEMPQIPDPLFPSWLTDFQSDGMAFLSANDFAPFLQTHGYP
ncbi:hypothetical protein FRC15_000230 [Serendipita sp. 397]|nr:hypothetical protein FRC15_000230 [Serendipita sp. 397]